jgi:uncharacterized membrane protein YkvA (DUF1232 family)
MRLLRFLPLFFTRFRGEAMMLWRVMRHPQTPAKTKLLAMLAVVYVISPIDLIPDVIPVLGLLDDVGVVMLLLSIAYKFLPKDLYDALRGRTHSNAKVSPHRGKREAQIIDVTPERQ